MAESLPLTAVKRDGLCSVRGSDPESWLLITGAVATAVMVGRRGRIFPTSIGTSPERQEDGQYKANEEIAGLLSVERNFFNSGKITEWQKRKEKETKLKGLHETSSLLMEGTPN